MRFRRVLHDLLAVWGAVWLMATPFLTGSYITCEEYRAAPTALLTNNLVPGGTQTDQDNELAGLIGRASRFLDLIAKQPLYATQTTVNETCRIDKDGSLVLKARQDRVKSIDALSYGSSWSALTTLTSITKGMYFVEENRTLFAVQNPGVTWMGSIPPRIPSLGSMYVSWTSTAGWVTTRLAVQGNATDTAVTLENVTGVQPGMFLRLANGPAQGSAQVASTYVPGTLTVALTAALGAVWPAGSWAGEVPDDVKEGGILATTHYIKMRKSGGFVMGGKSATVDKRTTQEIGEELIQAEVIALRYERRTP